MEHLGSQLKDFHEIWHLSILRKPVERIRVSLNSDKNNGRVLYKKTDIRFWSYLAQFFSELEMFQTKVVEKIKTHILCSVTFSRIRAVYGIMQKNMVQLDRPEITIRRMRIERCIPKATNTHSEHEILIGFPLQKWLQKCASMLRHTYTACLFFLLWSDLGIYILKLCPSCF
jgi:hypothetical protein